MNSYIKLYLIFEFIYKIPTSMQDTLARPSTITIHIVIITIHLPILFQKSPTFEAEFHLNKKSIIHNLQ